MQFHTTDPVKGIFSTGLLLLATLLAAAGVACGIEYSTASEETEIFKDMTIDGNFTAGSQLTMHLEYEQPYPVEIRMSCDVLSAEPLPTRTPRPTATPRSPARSPEPTAIRIPKEHPTPANRITGIPVANLPPNEAAQDNPDATPDQRTFEVQFYAPPEAGEYVVRCYTTNEPSNAIAEPLSVVPGPASLPTPDD